VNRVLRYGLAVIIVSYAVIPPTLMSQSQVHTSKILPYPTPLSAHEVKGGYWRSDHTFEPALIITNLLEEQSLTVSPSLYAADGTEFELLPVTLTPAGVTNIDVRAALAGAPAEIRQHFTEYGSAGVRYQWNWDGAINTMLQNRDSKRSLIFNFDLHSTTPTYHDAVPSVVEGLWWKEDARVRGFLGLVNIANRPLNVNLQVLSDKGELEEEKVLQILPNETRLLDLLKGAHSQSGGIRVLTDGSQRDLVLAGGLENPVEGYSARMPFSMTMKDSKQSTISISSVGLMYGKPDPMMKFPAKTEFGIYLALRNTTGRTVAVTPALFYMEGEEVRTSSLKELTLGPNQSRRWSPEELSAYFGLTKLPGMINLVFSYEGTPSDVLLANGVIDKTKSYVFESHISPVGRSQAKALNDWDVSNGNDTMMSFLNLGEDEQDLLVTFYFDGGRYKLPVHLRVGASTMFNVSEIIMEQKPDPDGNIIPREALYGTSVLSGAQSSAEFINVAVASGVFNVARATCGNKCPTCLGYNGFQVTLGNPFCADGSSDGFCPLGLSATFHAMALQQNGAWADISAVSGVTSWSSSASTVASSQGYGHFLGQALGRYSGNAQANLIDINPDCGATGSPCPNSPWSGGGSGGVAPTITLSPALWYFGRGNTPPSGFPGGITTTATAVGGGNGSYVWTITSGTSKAILENNSSTITKTNANTVVITSTSYSTQGNDVTIQLQYTPSGGSQLMSSHSFSIDSPYKLILISSATTGAAQGMFACEDPTPNPQGTDGFQTLYHYSIKSFFGSQVTFENANETFALQVDTYVGNTWPAYVVNPGFTSTGNFDENICAVGTTLKPRTLPNQSPLGNVEIDYGSQFWFIGSLAEGSGIEVQGDTLSRYQDHGTITNIVSPDPVVR
jgi:hypothetical protein